MPGVVRIGDIGIGVCPAHVSPVSFITVITSGAANTLFNNGLAVAHVGTIGVSSCGHNTVAVNGSAKLTVEGSPVHRIGDTCVNPGAAAMVSGSSDFLTV